MNIIVKKWGGNSVGHYFEHTESQRKFRRIVGGFAWPGKKPGFAVAVGEEFDPDPTTKKRHLWVVGETEDFDVQNLSRRATEFKQIYYVEAFYGDSTIEPMMQLLRHSGLSLREAPYADNEHSFLFYVSTIQGCLKPEKYLHFGDNSKLPGYLLEVKPEDTPSPDAEAFPAIAAIGYAVSYLMLHQPLPPLDKPQQQNLAKSYAVNLDFRKRYQGNEVFRPTKPRDGSKLE